MATYFEAPTAPLVPAAVNSSHPGYALMRHYRNWNAGINLFVVNGQLTTVEPDYEAVTPERVYLGGHIYQVSPAEAALLTAAGYVTFEGVPAVADPPLPGFTDVTGDTVVTYGEYGYAGYGDFEYGGSGSGIGGFDTVNYDTATYDTVPKSGLPGFQDVYS